MIETPRADHIDWCKERALAYIESGDTTSALASLFSDLRKHPETADHPGIELGGMLMLGGHLATREQVRTFVEGFK